MILNKEGRNPTHPEFGYYGENLETPTVSAQQIEQQVERTMQSITTWLLDHVNQQIGPLEAIVSKSTNLNDDGQHVNRYN